MSWDRLGERIVQLHDDLRTYWPHLSRLAVAIYDPETDRLNTFVNSTDGDRQLRNYSARLTDVPSLKQLADTGKPRIKQQLNTPGGEMSPHTRWLLDAGFASSYTVPLYGNQNLVGFLFFDADRTNYFTEAMVRYLAVYTELISAIITNQLAPIYILRGALNTVRHLTLQRDSETAGHIQRVGHYAQFIAFKLAPRLNLSDEYIEFVLQYAPMHDIGKIGVPDHVLLKRGELSREEFEVAKIHVQCGMDIVDSIVQEFELGDLAHIDILRNIIATHHEWFDGGGYPIGLAGDAIPLEGRITAVADVLDALTTRRSYKEAWSFEDAIAYLQARAGKMFDPLCVAPLIDHIEQLKEIHDCFKEGGEPPPTS
ncbi:HD domain-containing phosphohydrolase [Sedimenticola sp.]|uniref:HD domain-containing phosphohydrolase n=1 Tax=Sedimenticola sp. TaxID=1940285 RepID=UPI003D14B8C8